MTGQPPDDDWSAPETAVMDAIRDALVAGRRAVVATVVAVEGRAYRRPGAKMLVDDGSVGSVTAGCLADEVRTLAEAVRASDESRVERFDLTDDEEWGLGLGCNGVVDLLLEPLDERFVPLADRYAAGEDGLALTVVDPGGTDLAVGDRAYAPDGDCSAVRALPEWLVGAVAEHARELYDCGASRTVTVEPTPESVATKQGPESVAAEQGPESVAAESPSGNVRVFVDPVCAPPDLYVLGSGADARPVSELAAKAGFRVTVVAFRGGRADPARFPRADRVVSASAPRVANELAVDDDTYAVVMSHNAVDDRLAVESLLDTPVAYIGLMGPESRFERVREEFDAAGRPLTDEELDRIYAPVGLDLGGGTPYQIATSIVGEALAVHNGREPRHLRERASPIHDRFGSE